MVRTQQRSLDKLVGYLAAQALEQRRSVLLFPSVSYLRSATGQDYYTVDNALDWLVASGKLDVNRNIDGSLWINLYPNAKGDI